MIIDGFKEKSYHLKWKSDNKPIAKIKAGDEITVLVPDSSTNQLRYDSKTEDMDKIDHNKVDAGIGPIYVEGAKPNDTLEVEILDIKTGNWGWSGIYKDFGLLKGRFEKRLIIWDIKDGYAYAKDFLRGIRIPIKPFLGIIGTSPKEGEVYDMIPPQYFGGNMDNKLNGIGAKVYLPVNVEGALLSIADPHASQGDGEICGTAIETSAEVKLKVNVIKNKKINRPYVLSKVNDINQEVIATMGISNDLYNAAKMALEDMLELLKRDYGLTYEEGYVLSSVIGNLRISEIVDEPHFVVTLVLPREIVENRYK